MVTVSNSSRATTIALVATFILAASFRLGWLAMNSHSVSFAGLAADNGDVARNIVVHDKWFVYNDSSPRPQTSQLVDPANLNYGNADRHPRYRQAIIEPPGLPLVLAGIWAISGSERFIYLQVLQLLIDSCMVFLIYWLSVHLFGRRSIGLVAAVLYAVYVPAVLLARLPHEDAWAGWFTMAALAIVLKARESVRPNRWLVALGFLLGIGAFFRPNVLLLPVGFALALAPWSGWARPLRFAAITLSVSLVLLVPWTVRNYEVFHTFVPVRTSLGWTLWGGLGELPNSFSDTGTDANTVSTVLDAHPSYVVGSPKFDKFLLSRSLSIIEAHPGFYLRLVGTRLLRSTVLPSPTKTASSSKLASAAAWTIPFLFIAALISSLLSFRLDPGRRWALALLASVAATTVAPYLLVHLEARYLVAVAFVYLILASVGATLIIDWATRHQATLRDRLQAQVMGGIAGPRKD
jgi:4-amino-4-deoxy-L-arabinose transferase-like glycosyltransferase